MRSRLKWLGSTGVLCVAIVVMTGCGGSGGSGGSGSGSNSLHTGSLMFIRAQLAQYGSGVEWIDFNGDGYVDQLLDRFDFSRNIAQAFVSFGTPAEILGAPVLISESSPQGVADFSGDGLPDFLTLVRLGSSAYDVAIHVQGPAGEFGPPMPVGIQSTGLAWLCELDGLPHADLLVSADGAVDTLVAYGGNGDGSFTLLGQSNPILGNFGRLDFIVDINGDGLDDQAGRDIGLIPSSFYVKLSLGDGTFGPEIQTTVAGSGFVEPADVNGDGYRDVVTSNGSLDTPGDRLMIHLGDADAAFATVVEHVFAAGFEVSYVSAMADVDEDGNIDVIVASPVSTSRGVSDTEDYVLYGNGDATFGMPLDLPGNPSFAARDLDRDGIADVLGRSGPLLLLIGFGNGDQTFREEAPETIATSADPRLLFEAAPDIDGDGHLDVYARNNGTDDYTVLYGNGSGGFEPGASPTAAYHDGERVDLDDDGDLDYYLFDELTGLLTIHRMYSRDDIRMLPPIPISNPGNWRLEYVDVDGDGEEDLFLHETLQTVVLFGLGNLQFEPLVPLSLRPFVVPFSAVPQFHDINGDDRPDYVWFNGRDDQFVVQLAEGMRSFGGEILSPRVPYTVPLFLSASDNFSDLNGDGRTDAAVTFSGGGFPMPWHLLVFLANADGMLNATQNFPVTRNISEARLRDVDGDEDVDIIVFDYETAGIVQSALVYLNDGSGNFQLSQHFEAHFETSTSSFFNFHLVDISGEGLVDIAAVNDTTGISVALSDGDGTFRGPYHFAVNSRTRANTPMFGDYDEDGDTDIVAATVTQDALFYLENRYVE